MAIPKCFSATAVQRRLLLQSPSHSSVHQASTLAQFLNNTLLPKIYAANCGQHHSVLLQALDDFTADPSMHPSEPIQIFADGNLRLLSLSVDSTSDLLSFLFAKQHQPASYYVVPDAYATHDRLCTLKRLGLNHEGSSDPQFFMACSKQFQTSQTQFGRRASLPHLAEAGQNAAQQCGSICLQQPLHGILLGTTASVQKSSACSGASRIS